MAGTRLDRLFTLLDTGSNSATRKAAALQIGEIQKCHPYDLHNLLKRTRTSLRSPKWETRVAAGQAVEAIVGNVPQWDPKPTEEAGKDKQWVFPSTLMTFATFRIDDVLSNGKKLLASGGEEFDLNLDEMTPQERLNFQRAQLKQRLGMAPFDDDFISNEDLIIKEEKKPREEKKVAAPPPVAVPDNTAGMTARQRNVAKRKARMLAKQQESKRAAPSDTKGQVAKKARTTKTVVTEQPQTKDKVVIEAVADPTKTFEEDREWPFQHLCEELCNDLFNPSWEVRHGAGIGLREILRLHAKGAGKTVDCPMDVRERVNAAYLEEYAIRLLCVFALDRFGDYVSDQVVAPVRETCAQALGALLKHMQPESVVKVFDIVIYLTQRQEWQVRHGGMLALKYGIAVRQDLVEILLPVVFPAILRGLQDNDDDVRSIAASSLLPIAKSLARLNPECLPQVLAILWDILLDLDDLSASTYSVMGLLAEFYSLPAVPGPALIAEGGVVDVPSGFLLPHEKSQHMNTERGVLATLVPRLWPFLRHNIVSVRLAALSTLQRLLESGVDVHSWLPHVLRDALQHIYNNVVVEERPEIRQASHEVWELLLAKSGGVVLWEAARTNLQAWFAMAVSPPGASTVALNVVPSVAPARVEAPKPAQERPAEGSTKRKRGRPLKSAKAEAAGPPEKKRHTAPEIPAPQGTQATDIPQDREAKELQVQLRVSGAKALGELAKAYPTGYLDEFYSVISQHLASGGGIQRFVGAAVLTEWAESSSDFKGFEFSDILRAQLEQLLMDTHRTYDEINGKKEKLRSECYVLATSLTSVGVPLSVISGSADTILSVEQGIELVTFVYDNFAASSVFQKLDTSVKEQLEVRKKRVLTAIDQFQREEKAMDTMVTAAVAEALVAIGLLTSPLDPIVGSLLAAVHDEENELLQRRAARSIARLLGMCTGQEGLNAAVLAQLRTMLCGHRPPSLWAEFEGENAASDNQTAKKTKGKRKEKKKEDDEGIAMTDITPVVSSVETDDRIRLANRGAAFAFQVTAAYFGENLFQVLPWMWEAITAPLLDASQGSISDQEPSVVSVVDALQLLPALVPDLHPSLYQRLVDDVHPLVFKFVAHPDEKVRTAASHCVSVLSEVITEPTMEIVIGRILPLLGDVEHSESRLGATEALHHIIQRLGINIVPYIVLLVVPILGRMSDQNQKVRRAITRCFATLVRLMPLEAGVADPPGLSKELAEQKQRERRFLEQLLDGSKLDNYALPIPIKADLRKYQQDGVNWLAFLNKYKLHGILCDDMGLGKTLQSICIMASDDHFRREQYQLTHRPEFAPLPNLVVCPPTVVGHWYHEILKFCCEGSLRPVLYAGKPQERKKKRDELSEYNVMICSYDILRNDIALFADVTFNYCILDEGHIIRNSRTKITQAVKMVQANHRLILSGTPIQNNVLELWSLFDFLMPGFLGTEKSFLQTYAKPILASRDHKGTVSEKDQEAGVLALEALHRQVLPFLLRRVKEDVLHDLPPKIIQDYYVELSPLQVRLYEDFAKTQAKHGVEQAILDEEGDKEAKGTHVFQALQYLRKLCSHPMLVLNEKHPEYTQVIKEFGPSIHGSKACPKLRALKELLHECGIGLRSNKDATQNDVEDSVTEQAVSNHRVLIFAQLKSMLDIVETDLLRAEMPEVSYLRLDGSVPASKRHGLVSTFNTDPTIDLLLLTTHVGGLGLNLTGADTVIFMEHDWNPMKDLQAMDRAHRIGQKRTVNVYRLITRGTLEEKIMGLQKFKLNIANSVINSENSSIHTMDTDQLLDLFDYSGPKQQEQQAGKEAEGLDAVGKPKAGKKASTKQVLEELEELWDASQYDEEYNLSSFIEKMQ